MIKKKPGDKEEARKFANCGIGHICVSLNAPVKEINDLTRDGYDLAIHALEVLKENHFEKTCINWVMHSNNADTLEEMLKLAEDYHVSSIAVMVFKPDSAHQREHLPTLEQMKKAAKIIKTYKGPVKIEVESCFSQLRALVNETFFFNKNVGITRGCGAGRDAISITVDGKITPCRHIEIEEETKSIKEYWENSETLKKLRGVEDNPKAPCKDCRYRNNCLPCQAVNLKLNHDIYMGEKDCALGQNQ